MGWFDKPDDKQLSEFERIGISALSGKPGLASALTANPQNLHDRATIMSDFGTFTDVKAVSKMFRGR